MTRNSSPSRFVAEIPQVYLRTEGTAAVRETSYRSGSYPQVEPPWARSRGTDWDEPQEESLQRAQAPEEDDEYAEYYPGCGVFHSDYGTGVIVEKWYKHDMCNVKVNFYSGRKAQFILNYNKLERVSLDQG
jgi:hypothetical protein